MGHPVRQESQLTLVPRIVGNSDLASRTSVSILEYDTHSTT